MAAPRKYTDAQRQAVWRLYERGLTARQISETCAYGTAVVAAFEIPRRSVSDLIARMTREAAVEPPTNPEEIDSLEMVNRFPERIARIFEEEITRLAGRQRRGQLTAKDVELLRKVVDLSGPLRKRLEGGKLYPQKRRGARREAAPAESVLQQKSREFQEGRISGPPVMEKPSGTRTQQLDAATPQSSQPIVN